MKLTFFGSSLLSSYWNGAATYYRGLLKSLARLGHEITFCEPVAYGRQERRDLEFAPDYSRVIVYREAAERDALVEEALRRDDWVIKCSGVGIWDRELEEGIAGAESRTASIAFLDVDAPATLGRIANDADDPFHRWIPRFDRIFTYGGGPPVITAYLRRGARSCLPIYNGLDPEEHQPLADRPPPTFDLLFMGNRLPDREARVEEFFFHAARLAPAARFALGGEGWSDRDLPENVTYLGHIPTTEHNSINGSARMVLNIHRESMVKNGWSPATRMFEAAGAASCQITDAWRGIEDFFLPGKEILVARSGAEVAEMVAGVDPMQAQLIGLAAQTRALREHTYTRRAQLLDAALRESARVAV